MQQTLRHGLELLASGQAQKEIAHNEALLAIDQQLQIGVASRGLSAPPLQPVAGVQFIVAANATGDWTGRDGALAKHDGFGWRFVQAVPGTIALVADEMALVVRGPTGWQAQLPVAALRIAGRDVLAAAPIPVADPSGGAVVDAEARGVLTVLLMALREQGIIA